MRFCLRGLEWKVEKIGEIEDVGATAKASPCNHSYFVGRICCWKVESSLCFAGRLWVCVDVCVRIRCLHGKCTLYVAL